MTAGTPDFVNHVYSYSTGCTGWPKCGLFSFHAYCVVIYLADSLALIHFSSSSSGTSFDSSSSFFNFSFSIIKRFFSIPKEYTIRIRFLFDKVPISIPLTLNFLIWFIPVNILELLSMLETDQRHDKPSNLPV